MLSSVAQQCFHKKYGILSDEFKRFKSAVHNPTVTGDWARHAYKELPKIPNPMSKDEAIAFVHHLAKKCLRDML